MKLKRFYIFLFILLFHSNIVFAQSSYETVLDFNQYNLERSLGFFGSTVLDVSIASSSGDLDVFNFSVYDVNNNKIWSGVQGKVMANESQFPLKFVCENSGYAFNINLRVKDGSAEQKDYTGLLNGLGDKLDNILSGLGSKLDSLNNKLAQLDNFLSNPQPFYDSVNRLNDKMELIKDYGPNGVAKDIAEGYSNSFTPSGSGNLPSMEVEFFKGQGKINVFDLSTFGNEIVLIRNLMKAILYLGVVFFIMQSVVPQFKV